MDKGSYIIISWEPGDPRGTVRLDGFYFDMTLATDAIRLERAHRRAAILAQVVDNDRIPIPDALDALFDMARWFRSLSCNCDQPGGHHRLTCDSQERLGEEL